ncbi:uncharacterized protein AMSG_10398 [Thecamonas trahens ATCC 50062]|uniref:VCBS repeat-containing protein n=1 Tax=Thecamonas trahens ATCC 50062 TaxID=461836 RepID=A0A0L0DQG4_THETB|nr:hypothetical protein AMSG_10398 [Thecamonas trahens ATCC 50062]KNC54549.1 hypothetical protein AMSG_10398 [Thecamonas trahens ATCC 50062]|eukprot:XP_013753564.1 hypothetical protein AMSG_10398 [Thecamonas trahens ATCC 50062]
MVAIAAVSIVCDANGSLGPCSPFSGSGGRIISGMTTDRIVGGLVGDVDNDGDVDVVVLTQVQARWSMKVYKNTGNGTFAESATITTVSNLEDATLVDVDGDGDHDALVLAGGETAWWENVDGDGEIWVEQAMNATSGRRMAVADVDIDGDNDVVVVGSSGIALLANNGSGVFEASTLAAVDAGDVIAAHIDNDSLVDIVARTSTGLVVLQNSRPAVKQWAQQTLAVPTELDSRAMIYVYDVDGDGDGDAVVKVYDGDALVWANNGDGVFGASQVLPASSIFAHGPTVIGDVNGDGRDDFVASDAIGAVYYQVRNGSAWESRRVTNRVESRAIGLADMDGNGAIDLVVNNGVVLSFVPNHGSQDLDVGFGPAETVRPWAASAIIYLMRAADVSGDRVPDLVVASNVGIEVFVNTGEETGAFAAAVVVTREPTRAVVAGDVDHDGDIDLVVGTIAGATLWFENNGSGGWYEHGIEASWSGAAAIEDVALADLDNDGMSELVAISNDGTLFWFGRGGESEFGGRNVGNVTQDWAGECLQFEMGDVDGDGAIDIVAACLPAGLVWFRNELATSGAMGPGRVLKDELGDGLGLDVIQAHVVDVDGDGDLDVVPASPQGASWAENIDGVGGVWMAHEADDGAVVRSVVDMDADGDVDLLVLDVKNGMALEWIETEAGVAFGRGRRHAVELSHVRGWGIGVDVDSDGDMDVVTNAEGRDRDGDHIWL